MSGGPSEHLPADPDVDRTLLRENLRLTPQQRIEKLLSFMHSLDRLRVARRPR